jgi:hypothetical protein
LSLILEALKKLEREKQSPDRGFLVLAHVPWAAAAGRGHRWPWIGGALVAGLALVVAFLRPGRAPQAIAPPLPPPSAAPQHLPSPLVDRSAGLPSSDRAPDARSVTPPGPRAASPGTSRDTSRGSDSPAEPTADETESATEAIAAAATPAPPREKPAPAGLELRLNAISQRDGRPVAILNDRLVREGDIFDGILVVRIGEDEVEVEVAGKRRVVRF